jgi:DNA repair exonuclease SbcCD ATPase subunit
MPQTKKIKMLQEQLDATDSGTKELLAENESLAKSLESANEMVRKLKEEREALREEIKSVEKNSDYWAEMGMAYARAVEMIKEKFMPGAAAGFDDGYDMGLRDAVEIIKEELKGVEKWASKKPKARSTSLWMNSRTTLRR